MWRTTLSKGVWRISHKIAGKKKRIWFGFHSGRKWQQQGLDNSLLWKGKLTIWFMGLVFIVVMWSDCLDSCSPIALDTETAEPFISPPSHLLNDISIQWFLSQLDDYVNIDTPFNVDKLELFLGDHLNQPFVRSIMKSLRERFWPFDEGAWDDYSEELSNYSSEELDLSAIRAFWDKECKARHWSPQLPFQHLLPGMKSSPMFIVLQKLKPQVITDHARSGLIIMMGSLKKVVGWDTMTCTPLDRPYN